MITSTLKKKKKDFFATLSKSASLIKKLDDKNLQPLLNKKSEAEIWIILENKFQHIFSISVIRIMLDIYAIKLSNCINVIDYTNRYQIVFDKLPNLFLNKS